LGAKLTHLRTFYHRKQVISIAAQVVWLYSGGPKPSISGSSAG